MKKDLSLTAIFSPIVNVFKNYNLTIFIVVLVGGLGVAVLMLSGALQKASQTDGYTSSTSTSTSTSFDQTTINRVNQLHTSSEAPSDYTPPSGRINPFAE